MLLQCRAFAKPFSSSRQDSSDARPKYGMPLPVEARARCVSVSASSELRQDGLNRRAAVFSGIASLTIAPSSKAAGKTGKKTSENTPRIGEIQHSEEEWKKILAPAAYNILRKGGTELPASSPLNREKRPGTFNCGGCSTPLFSANSKFESGTGWPSFTEALDNAVTELPDYSIPFYARTEVRCKKCAGHIGHVFPDGPPPTGQRYCMNGAALTFEPAQDAV